MPWSKVLVLPASLALATILAAGPSLAASGSPAPPTRAAVPGSESGAVAGATNQGAVSGSSTISFDVTLSPRDAAGAAAVAQQVSDPSSPSYRDYLTAKQWEAEFSPTAAQVSSVTSWLTSQGLTVNKVSADQLSLDVTGTAAQIDTAFGTSLNNYAVQGRSVRMTSAPITVPSDLASIIQGVPGLNQVVATTSDTTGADPAPATPDTSSNAPDATPIPPEPGFRNATPCSTSYGQTTDTTDPTYGDGYPAALPYAVCGYTPQQLESAYGLATPIANGIDGAGQTVAIVDAYESSTLLSDAQQYFTTNDPAIALPTSQFSTLIAPTFDQKALCQASGWNGEQTLDVEAVHSMAPGAHILYVGAKDCINGLLDSERQIVDGHLADIITNSWGDDGGDVLDSSSDRAANDTVFEMAIATGISVLFSAGDDGDEYSTVGLTTPDYPPSSPYVTAVGGTSLEIGADGSRLAEVGWSTSKSTLCTTAVIGDVTGCTKKTLGAYLPPAPGGYDYGGGGGTSFNYPQPYYQAATVPSALAERNTINGSTPFRVEPDISMDADPGTGFLEGETQRFGKTVEYSQYRIGGTSLASPLFAGILALSNQVSGTDIGFANPTLYKVDEVSPQNIYDVVPDGKQALVRNDFVNGTNNGAGITTSVRTLDYQGLETYCDATGNCGSQHVALTTAKGFDSMTGLGTPNTGFIRALAKE